MPLSILPVSIILSIRSQRIIQASSFLKIPLLHSAIKNLNTLGLFISSRSRKTLSASANFSLRSIYGPMKTAQATLTEEIQLRTVPMMNPMSNLVILTVWRLKLKQELPMREKGMQRVSLNLACGLLKGKEMGPQKARLQEGSVKMVLVMMGGAFRTSVSASSACRMRMKRCLFCLTWMSVVQLRAMMASEVVLSMKRVTFLACTSRQIEFSTSVKVYPPRSQHPNKLLICLAMCGLMAITASRSSKGRSSSLRETLMILA